jgi:hypothetical protein
MIGRIEPMDMKRKMPEDPSKFFYRSDPRERRRRIEKYAKMKYRRMRFLKTIGYSRI